jgi:uncharacterized protein YigE (DUF2233 family)
VVNARLLLLGLAIVSLRGAEPDALQPTQQADLPQGMGTVRRLLHHVAGERDEAAQPLLAVVLAAGAYRAQLVDQSPTFPVGARTVAQTRALVPAAGVAINGGYFDPHFQPQGLCRIAGRELSPLSPQGVLSGVVGIAADGGVRLLARDAVLTDLPTAFQAGPYVIDPGGALGVRAHPARANRSVIACDDHGGILLLATGPLTLFQLATLLHDHAPALGLGRIERALNLDGGPSTGLSTVLDGAEWSLAERGPVRNVLVFTPAPR